MRDKLAGLGSAPGRTDAGLSDGAQSSPSRERPTDADIHRFRQAFRASVPESAPPAGDDASPLPAGPFDLFRSGGAVVARHAAAHAGVNANPDMTAETIPVATEGATEAATRGAIPGATPMPTYSEFPHVIPHAVPHAVPHELAPALQHRVPDAVQPDAAASQRQQLQQRLSDMVSRLMVGDGGQAPRLVRMTLDDALLAGVDLSVYEEQGFWVAHFSCRVPESFIQLAAPGGDMAVRLASALMRPSLWRVEGESFPGEGDWRRYANVDGEPALAEFRAQP